MSKLSLMTQAFYDANQETIHAAASAAVGAFNAVKNGPKEIFSIDDQRLLHECRKMSGWPALPGDN